MWILYLNHWRDKAEIYQPIALAEEKKTLEDYVESKLVPPYYDENSKNWNGWSQQVFFKDELKNYNPPYDSNDEECYRKFFNREEYIQKASEDYDIFVNNLRFISK